MQLDPLGWLGPTVAIYVDRDPIWKKLADAEDPDKFAEEHFTELPVVLYLQSSNPLKLTVFLVALHGFIDASAPGQTVWAPVKYGDFTYTKISPSDQAKAGDPEFKNDSICYAVAGGALLLSPNEETLRRAINRQSARVAASTQPAATQPAAPEAAPWLGENLCAQIDLAAAERAIHGFLERDDELTIQERAWANLPILNEWHRRFPTAEPVQVQEKLFQTLLTDPAGGRYVWSDSLQTMESTNYGCPESPKKGPILPAGFAGLGEANFGITFENDGMRARVELQRQSAK